MSKGILRSRVGSALKHWRWKNISNGTGQILYAEGFGKFMHAVQETAHGLFDRILQLQHPSVTIVVERASDGRFAFIHNWRPVLSLRSEVVYPDDVRLEDLGEYLWEIPGGLLDGERGDFIGCGMREATEETGWRVRDPTVLGWYHPDPANNTTKIPILHVIAYEAHEHGHDEADGIREVQWWTLGEVRTNILEGLVPSAHTLSSMMLFLLRLDAIEAAMDAYPAAL